MKVLVFIGSPYILPPFSSERYLVTISWPEGLFSCRISGFPLFKVGVPVLSGILYHLSEFGLPTLFLTHRKSTITRETKFSGQTSSQIFLQFFPQIRCPLRRIFDNFCRPTFRRVFDNKISCPFHSMKVFFHVEFAVFCFSKLVCLFRLGRSNTCPNLSSERRFQPNENP